MQPTDVVHVYSYETGVSFELPVGFESDEEAPSMASYADRDDDDTAVATVVVRRVARIDDDDAGDAVRQLIEATKAGQLDDVTDERTEEVDQVTVTTVVGRATRESGEAVVRHVSAAAVDGRLVSISALALADRGDELLPAFDRAVRSVRWVTL